VQAVYQDRLWSRILRYFVAFPIEADVPTLARPFKGPQDIRGVSTIAGLPLPNSGHYGGESWIRGMMEEFLPWIRYTDEILWGYP